GMEANQQGSANSIQRICERHRLNISTVRKAREFARKYSRAELQKFCALKRRNGLPLHWGHVIFLLSMPCGTSAERARRQEFQKETANNSWTSPQMYATIKVRFPNKRQERPGSPAGRKRKPLGRPEEAVQMLKDRARELLGRCN